MPRACLLVLIAFAALSAAGSSLTRAFAGEASPWKVSGSMRLRYEAVDGQVRPGFNASDDLLNLRTTLFVERRFGAVRFGGEIYDSRAWGGDRRTPISTNEVNTFEAVQAYVGLDGKNSALGAYNVQAGRLLLNLGSRRLVAADDYRNTTNSYTGLRVDAAPGGVRTTLVYVQPQLRLPDGLDAVLDNRHRVDRESDDLVLWGGVAARPRMIGPATLEGSYFRLDERDAPGRPTRDRHLDTFGLRIVREPAAGIFDYEVEAIGQTGRIRRGLAPADPYLKVRAGFLHAEAGYSFRHSWKPRLSGEFDLATGDDSGGDYGRFDTLFGMRRADLAPAGLYNAIGRANIVTPGLRLELTPSPRWDAFLAARTMWLEARADAFSTTGVRDGAGRAGAFAGNQVEGRIRWWIVRDRLRAEANGLWLDKGRFLRRAPNAPATGDGRYMSLNLTAQF
jgi:hypothetical protein